MSKADEDAMAQLMLETFALLSAWNGTRVRLAADEAGFAAGTPGVLKDVAYYKDNKEVVAIFCPDGKPESHGWCVALSALLDETGHPLPQFYVGEAFMEQLAGPIYPKTDVDAVTQIFAQFAPDHRVADQFKEWYTRMFGTNVELLSLYMKDAGLNVKKWSVQEMAKLYADCLNMYNEEVPALVKLCLATPNNPSTAPQIDVNPTNQAASSTPVESVALPSTPVPFTPQVATVSAAANESLPREESRIDPVVVPTHAAVKVAAELPVLLPSEPVGEPATLLEAELEEDKALKPVKEKRKKKKREAGAVNLQLVGALIPFLTDAETFEDDVNAAVQALLLIHS